MVDRKRWEESLRRARRVLAASSPEARARKRATAERAAAAENKKRAELVVDQMLRRQAAMREIERELDQLEQEIKQLEQIGSWLIYGKSRGAR